MNNLAIVEALAGKTKAKGYRLKAERELVHSHQSRVHGRKTKAETWDRDFKLCHYQNVLHVVAVDFTLAFRNKD